MKIKILNLNIWNYEDFENRKSKIVEFFKKENPDVITLQEVRDDERFNTPGNNQLLQINKELKYPHHIFSLTTNKQKERPEKYKKKCVEGLAILSKFPIKDVKNLILKKHPDDRYTCGILHVKIKGIDTIVVHFSNSNLFSLLHLIETLRYIKDNKIKPIIIGDFNILNPGWITDLTKDDYKCSYDLGKYYSYPSKNEVLDYILIPKKLRFKSFKCEGEGLSDHMALIAEVEIK